MSVFIPVLVLVSCFSCFYALVYPKPNNTNHEGKKKITIHTEYCLSVSGSPTFTLVSCLWFSAPSLSKKGHENIEEICSFEFLFISS